MAEALPPEAPQGTAKLRVLLADDVGAEGSLVPRAVPLVADLLGQVQHDGHRQAVVLAGQFHQRLAGLGLDIGGVDDRQPPVPEAYLGFIGALGHGVLPARVREQLALNVGEANDCDYCVSAHCALGKGAGLNDQDILDSRRGVSADPKEDVLLRFARTVLEIADVPESSKNALDRNRYLHIQ
jgi:AhpD family alkylhydroperoxidase